MQTYILSASKPRQPASQPASQQSSQPSCLPANQQASSQSASQPWHCVLCERKARFRYLGGHMMTDLLGCDPPKPSVLSRLSSATLFLFSPICRTRLFQHNKNESASPGISYQQFRKNANFIFPGCLTRARLNAGSWLLKRKMLVSK